MREGLAGSSVSAYAERYKRRAGGLLVRSRGAVPYRFGFGAIDSLIGRWLCVLSVRFDVEI